MLWVCPWCGEIIKRGVSTIYQGREAPRLCSPECEFKYNEYRSALCNHKADMWQSSLACQCEPPCCANVRAEQKKIIEQFKEVIGPARPDLMEELDG